MLDCCGFGYPAFLVCHGNDLAPFTHPYINHASEDIGANFRTYATSLLHVEVNSYLAQSRNLENRRFASTPGEAKEY